MSDSNARTTTPSEDTLTADPVGSGSTVVKEGDCISSIAYQHGHLPDTLWNDPGNAQLKAKRGTPSALLPGDRVHVPPIREKQEAGATERRHKFKLKGVPEVLRIRFLDEDGEPEANERYIIVIDGVSREGITNADGELVEPISPDAVEGKVTLPDLDREYRIHLGHLDPVDTPTGVQARLNNLGFSCGAVDGKIGPMTISALQAFQRAQGLDPSGKPDGATLQQLKNHYGT